MNFLEAIQQIADELESGATVAEALREASEEFAIPVAALRNRFEKAHGGIDTFVGRKAEARAALATSQKETVQRRVEAKARAVEENAKMAEVISDFFRENPHHLPTFNRIFRR